MHEQTRGRSTVLIVDDVPENLEVLAHLISDDGNGISVARNGREAVSIASSGVPDLILMEVNMPEMDGFAACERLKEEPKTRDIPVIFLTARNDEKDIIRGFEAGGVDYVTKPFQASELLARVRTHLELQRFRRLIVEQNKRLKSVIRQLNESNATKDRFFSILAHDMRNPVFAFRQIPEILLDSEKDMDEGARRDLLKTMLQSSTELYNLLENLLNWSNSQTGRIEFEPCVASIAPIVNETLSLMAMNARNKNIVLASEINGEISAFHDQNMLSTILRNLVSNAIKFTPEGGRVTLKAEEDGDFIRMAVADTGIGLSRDDVSKLFRADVSMASIGSSKQGKGSGLGLVLCRDFVRAHRGEFSVESREGGGSTFYFTLPRTAGAVFPDEPENA
jgi:signal transduction histidine kinase